MEPKWLIIKVVAQKDAVLGQIVSWIVHVAHHFGSLSGAIELIVLCVFCMHSMVF